MTEFIDKLTNFKLLIIIIRKESTQLTSSECEKFYKENMCLTAIVKREIQPRNNHPYVCIAKLRTEMCWPQFLTWTLTLNSVFVHKIIYVPSTLKYEIQHVFILKIILSNK